MSMPISFLVTGAGSATASGFAAAVGAALATREVADGGALDGWESFGVDAVTCGAGIVCGDEGSEAVAATVGGALTAGAACFGVSVLLC